MILGIGIGAAAVVAVIAIVAVLFATGVIGGGGGVDGGSGANPQDLILEDAPFVVVQNVAMILGTEFPDGIPQQMLRFQVLNMPDGIEVDLEDADEWKEEWGDVFADNMPGWMKESITLQEVNYAMEQGFGGSREIGLIISGNFDFEGIRGTLEDDKEDGGAGLKDGEYRDFEVWGDNEIALLEDRGLIAYSIGGTNDFVQGFLRALDRGGFVDDDSGLKRVLDKVGNVLVMSGDPDCATGSFFPTSEIERCEGRVDAVEGGDVFESTVSGVYVFRNENSAESGRDDIEDAIEDLSNYDADAERVENSREFVTYLAIIHQDYDYEPPAPRETPEPTAAPEPRAATSVPEPTAATEPRWVDSYRVAQEFLRCGLENRNNWVEEQVQQYPGASNAVEIIAENMARENSYSELLGARLRECGY